MCMYVRIFMYTYASMSMCVCIYVHIPSYCILSHVCKHTHDVHLHT